MIEELIKGNEQPVKKVKKIEQLIIERPIRFYKPSYCAVDDGGITIFAAKKWTNVVDRYSKYELKELLNSGYRVVSITKAFMGKDEGDFYGVETAILERETYINEYE